MPGVTVLGVITELVIRHSSFVIGYWSLVIRHWELSSLHLLTPSPPHFLTPAPLPPIGSL